MTDMLTKDDAAAWLGISVDTLETLMRTGKIPFYRLAGRIIRIHREDLVRYVESCRVEMPDLTGKKRGPSKPPRVCGYVKGMDVV